MNTQSHAILTFWIIRKGFGERIANIKNCNPVLIFGALVPDLPLYIFFLFYTFIAPTPQIQIWRTLYFQPGWQILFNLFHSFPVWGILSLVLYFTKFPRAALFFCAALIASLQDFFVHHEDAHAHFFPISDYRLASPVSYWNPAYYGTYFTVFEIFIVIFVSIWSYHRLESNLGKIILIFSVVMLIAGNGLWSVILNHF